LPFEAEYNALKPWPVISAVSGRELYECYLVLGFLSTYFYFWFSACL